MRPIPLTRALWPSSRLNQTTPLNLALVIGCVVVGLALYQRGYTYEGGMLAFVMSFDVLALPYFLSRYAPITYFVIMLPILPPSIWAQNRGARAGNWAYPEHPLYLLGKITQAGEGPLHWTRLLWFGNDMPVVDVCFYVLMSFFHMATFTLLFALMPPRLTRPRVPSWVFYAFFTALTGFFASLPVVFARSSTVFDYTWCVMGVGFPAVWAGVIGSPSFRKLVKTPVLWLFLLLNGAVYTPLWEFFHCCVNHDYWFVLGRSLPPAYSYDGIPITMCQPPGYLVWALVMPAMLSLYADRFSRLVVRDPAAVFTRHLEPPLNA